MSIQNIIHQYKLEKQVTLFYYGLLFLCITLPLTYLICNIEHLQNITELYAMFITILIVVYIGYGVCSYNEYNRNGKNIPKITSNIIMFTILGIFLLFFFLTTLQYNY